MKNIKLGHALSFYMHRTILLSKKIKKILGISKAIRVFVSPPTMYLAIWVFCPYIQRSMDCPSGFCSKDTYAHTGTVYWAKLSWAELVEDYHTSSRKLHANYREYFVPEISHTVPSLQKDFFFGEKQSLKAFIIIITWVYCHRLILLLVACLCVYAQYID